MAHPTATFRVYNGTTDSDPLVFTSGVDTTFEVTLPFPYLVVLSDVDLDGGTYLSWLVDLRGDASIEPGDNTPADGSTGSGSASDAGTYTPVLHFFSGTDTTGTDSSPILPAGAGGGGGDFPGIGDCASFSLETASAEVIFDCETPDESFSGVVWVWQNVDGWWEPPAPERPTIDGLGIPVVSAPRVLARWQPRGITLEATAICGSLAALQDARDTLTALCDMLRTPGTFAEVGVKTIAVRLADRPTADVLGDALGLTISIPMIAHDPMRFDGSDRVL